MTMNSRRTILLVGPRSSGKTSIVNVIFDGLPTKDCLYNESTRIPRSTYFNAFLDFELWDLPGGRYDVDSIPEIDWFKVGSVVFVIDGQSILGNYSADPSQDQTAKIAYCIHRLHRMRRSLKFDVFLHKVESMSEEYKNDLLVDVRRRLVDDLSDLADYEEGKAAADGSAFSSQPPDMAFHFTTIHEPVLHEALSKVIQKMLPCQAALEQLLDIICQQSGMEKAFLCHLPTKLHVATDSSPVSTETHEMCMSYVDLWLDFDNLYAEKPRVITGRSGKMSRQSSQSHINTMNTHGSENAKFATSRVKLANGISIAHWEIEADLFLVALMRTSTLEHSHAIVEHNIIQFREAIHSVKSLEIERLKAAQAAEAQ